MSGEDILQILKTTILFSMVVFLTSCSLKRGLSLFFDVPDKPSQEVEAVSREEKGPRGKKEPDFQERTRTGVEGEVIPPSPDEAGDKLPIEKTLVWEEAEELLPKDELGEVDWMEALRRGIIKPRSSVEGGDDHFVFKFNFHFPGPSGLLGAYFPHSAHTQWLTCESCHPVIFPQPGTPLSMAKILSDEYCGKCHTKVAFPIAKGCNRCHAKQS
jgi:c(7)-type cytochrome triheme protein